MYPVLRLLHVLATARRRSALQPWEPSELRMTVRPWDCDMFGEVNNGRYFTLFDLGRFDVALRTGLSPILRQRRWGLVVAGSTIRYRKRLRPFQRWTMRTVLAGRDDRWFYFAQSAWRNGEACASALVRTGVTAKGSVLPTQEVCEALGHPEWRPDLPAWMQGWAQADRERPWPPEE